MRCEHLVDRGFHPIGKGEGHRQEMLLRTGCRTKLNFPYGAGRLTGRLMGLIVTSFPLALATGTCTDSHGRFSAQVCALDPFPSHSDLSDAKYPYMKPSAPIPDDSNVCGPKPSSKKFSPCITDGTRLLPPRAGDVLCQPDSEGPHYRHLTPFARW